jgi:hypothetical protein
MRPARPDSELNYPAWKPPRGSVRGSHPIPESATIGYGSLQRHLGPQSGRPLSSKGSTMEIVATLTLFYLAVGAALFAHARYPGMPQDFDWRSQIGIFRATLPEVLAWPVTLWRLRYDRD